MLNFVMHILPFYFSTLQTRRLDTETKRKHFADDKFNVTHIKIYVSNRLENSVEKGENNG